MQSRYPFGERGGAIAPASFPSFP
ncbi:protein of unknown function [Cupriavidus taiwanensis]|nr:protein of unknown function [Cupriavidus taiwanensis]